MVDNSTIKYFIILCSGHLRNCISLTPTAVSYKLAFMMYTLVMHMCVQL